MKAPRFLRATSRRVFVVYPVVLLLVEWLLKGNELRLSAAGVPLLAWGYLQFTLAGRYRSKHGGGGPGLANPPERLVTTGIYAYTRNPMYLGMLIFLAGLAVLLHSYIAALLALAHVPWFHRRVRADEARLFERFGEQFAEYREHVRRWVPGIV